MYIDARRPGVAVPEHLQNETRLVLQYGLNMPVPVEDLEVTEAGVKATLSFSRQPYQTLIPWSAIYVIACTDGRGVLYQEDVPPELIASLAADKDIDEGHKPPAKAEPKRVTPLAVAASKESTSDEPSVEPHDSEPRARLKSVPMPEEPVAEDAPSETDDEEPSDESPRRGRPKLRLVKT